MRRFCVLALLVAGCAGAPVPRVTAAKLQVLSEPADATVYLDEEFFGSAKVLALHPKKADKGLHRLTIQSDGYFPHDMDVDLQPGTTKLEIKLRKIPE